MIWYALLHPFRYRRAMRQAERLLDEYELTERWAAP